MIKKKILVENLICLFFDKSTIYNTYCIKFKKYSKILNLN